MQVSNETALQSPWSPPAERLALSSIGGVLQEVSPSAGVVISKPTAVAKYHATIIEGSYHASTLGFTCKQAAERYCAHVAMKRLLHACQETFDRATVLWKEKNYRGVMTIANACRDVHERYIVNELVVKE